MVFNGLKGISSLSSAQVLQIRCLNQKMIFIESAGASCLKVDIFLVKTIMRKKHVAFFIGSSLRHPSRMSSRCQAASQSVPSQIWSQYPAAYANFL